MPSTIPHESLVWVARVVLGGTFLVSAALKLRDLQSFARGAQAYDLLPPAVVRPLARLMPFGELALGFALVAGLAPRLTAMATLGVLGVFAVAVGVNLWRGRAIPCHCFGGSDKELIGAATLARLGVLGAAALAVATWSDAPAAALGAVPLDDLMARLSMVVSGAVVVASLGPGATLWREVTAVRQAASQRRLAERRGKACKGRPTKPSGLPVPADRVNGHAAADAPRPPRADAPTRRHERPSAPKRRRPR